MVPKEDLFAKQLAKPATVSSFSLFCGGLLVLFDYSSLFKLLVISVCYATNLIPVAYAKYWSSSIAIWVASYIFDRLHLGYSF